MWQGCDVKAAHTEVPLATMLLSCMISEQYVHRLAQQLLLRNRHRYRVADAREVENTTRTWNAKVLRDSQTFRPVFVMKGFYIVCTLRCGISHCFSCKLLN